MRIFAIGLIVTIAAAVFQPIRSSAMSFELHPNNSETLLAIFAQGEIELGDAEELESFFLNQSRRKNTAVYLASPGGYLYEGMKMGRIFK